MNAEVLMESARPLEGQTTDRHHARSPLVPDHNPTRPARSSVTLPKWPLARTWCLRETLGANRLFAGGSGEQGYDSARAGCDGLGESVGGAVLDGVEQSVLLGPRQFQNLT